MSHDFTTATLLKASETRPGFMRMRNPKMLFAEAVSNLFKRGLVHISFLEEGRTIDHHSYIEDCLKPIVKVLKNERPITGAKNMKFHHDNARPHVHKSVIELLKEEKFVIMSHPPY